MHEPCCEGCRGWALIWSDDVLEVQRCDECRVFEYDEQAGLAFEEYLQNLEELAESYYMRFGAVSSASIDE